jgi:outer membrane protein OmpA-like peptidoglycan-associated protein
MNKKNTFIISLLCLLICAQTDAQSKGYKAKKKKVPLNHEISFYGAGGLSNLSYKPATGVRTNGLGGDVGLGYSYFVTPQWGIGTGAGIAIFNASTKLDGFEYVISGLNDGEDDFDLYTSFTKWTEKQRIMMLTVPLTVTYRKDWKDKQWYVGAGVKVGLPVSANSNVNNGEVTKHAYYPQYDNWATTQQFMGFGDYSGVSVKNKLNLKPAFFASIDAGLQWKLKENLLLYTGLYFDYGLNSISNPKEPFLTWNLNSPQDFQPNSLLNTEGSSDKASPIAAGVKLRVAFAFVDKGTVKKLKQADKSEKERLAAEEAERQRLIAEETARKQAEEAEKQRLIAEETARKEAEQQRLIAEKEKQVDLEKQQIDKIAREEYLFAVSEIEQTYSEFRLDQIEPSASTKAELDNVVVLMVKYPNVKLVIEGHTCNIGTHDQNIRVGQRRADAAKKYLTGKGIDPDRVYTDTKGDSDPVLPNTSEEYRRKNRRIEIKVLKQ